MGVLVVIDRCHVVKRFLFTPMVEDPNGIGLLGMGLCAIDGFSYGPFIVIRGPDGLARTNYCLSLEECRVPECLHDGVHVASVA